MSEAWSTKRDRYLKVELRDNTGRARNHGIKMQAAGGEGRMVPETERGRTSKSYERLKIKGVRVKGNKAQRGCCLEIGSGSRLVICREQRCSFNHQGEEE